MEPSVTEESKSANQTLQQEKFIEDRFKAVNISLMGQKMDIDHIKTKLKFQDEKAAIFVQKADALTRDTEANSKSLKVISQKIKEIDACLDVKTNADKKTTALEKKTKENLKNIEKVIEKTKNDCFNRISNVEKAVQSNKEEVKRLEGKFEAKIIENTTNLIESVGKIDGTLEKIEERLGNLEGNFMRIEGKLEENTQEMKSIKSLLQRLNEYIVGTSNLIDD